MKDEIFQTDLRNIIQIFLLFHILCKISNAPVPTVGTLPRTIYEEGVVRVSISLTVAAFVKNFTHVSNDIFKNELILSSIQALFIAFIYPLNVR